MTDFVHLHVHSDFSLLDAAVSVMDLADKAEELGMKYLALTDHGNMFGTMEFIKACGETVNENGRHEKRKKPVKPIIGCEVYVCSGSRFDKNGSESENRYYHLVMLAANRKGYFNLAKLCSLAYIDGFSCFSSQRYLHNLYILIANLRLLSSGMFKNIFSLLFAICYLLCNI